MRKTLSVAFSAMLIGLLSLSATYSPNVVAASDAECSIWLCLPMGFPSGCGEAKSAFKSRVKRMKSPLPSFSGCANSDSPHSSTMTHKEGYVAKMPDGTYIKGRCIDRYRKGDREWEPYGCTGTWKYVDTYMDGQLYGDRFYYQ